MASDSVKSGNVLITGGTGFIGRHLCDYLLEQGYQLWVLSRNPVAARNLLNAKVNVVGSLSELATVDFAALINLAGESLASARWSDKTKQKFRASRVDFTHSLFDFFARIGRFPKVLLNASAVGFYGNCVDRLVDERENAGNDFAAQLCCDWEAAALRFEVNGVRVCRMRFGIVLERDGGALKQMLPAFRMGLGGRMGTGRHYMPWIHRHDLLRLMLFLLQQERASGVFNVVAPEPVTNLQFTALLAQSLHRPALLPMPESVLRLLFGEMADALLLSGQRVVPAAAQSLGFEFEYPHLQQAFTAIFKK
ncbi:TIGR01777 family oxidoreductase [Cellvibrio sp.]